MILKILVFVIAIVSVAAVVAMFTKDKYTLVRQVVINAPKQEVFDYIKLNSNQKSYSKWLSLDPQTKIGFKGSPDGKPGSILTFESNDKKAGTGELETKRVIDGERVEFELRFLAPFQFTANGFMSTDAVSPGQTRVTWVYNSGMNWPKNFMLLFMDMDSIVGNDIQISLGNLKSKLEHV